jgi:RNA-directed DNA polymerase
MHKNNNQPTLLERISSFENLLSAHRECSRGKRGTTGYRQSLFAIGEKLVVIRNQLLSGTYKWDHYRSFIVKDPKARMVMAAPFMDRVVHHAIHRIIEPGLDLKMSDSVFACRHGRGNRNAVIATLKALKNIGPDRYVVKMDVKKYFASINHTILQEKLRQSLPDTSLHTLIEQLLGSHPEFRNCGRGIPIGTLTSQIFANLFLINADQIAAEHLQFPYYWTDETLFSNNLQSFYVRYMDDLLVIAKSKKSALDAADSIIDCCRQKLDLDIPFQKKMHIGSDPVPFLGFVLNHDSYRPLSRNQHRFRKKIKRHERIKAPDSKVAQVANSFQAWTNLALPD